MSNVPYVAPVINKGLLDVVEGLVSKKEVYDEVMPFFLNGGKCGHKVMDVKGAVDVVREADTDGLLNNFFFKDKEGVVKPIDDFRLGNALKDIIRRRVKLNTSWKAIDVNDKVAEANPEAAKHFRDFLIVIGYKPEPAPAAAE